MWSRGPFSVLFPLLWCRIQKIITETDGAELTAVFSPGGAWVQASHRSLPARFGSVFTRAPGWGCSFILACRRPVFPAPLADETVLTRRVFLPPPPGSTARMCAGSFLGALLRPLGPRASFLGHPAVRAALAVCGLIPGSAMAPTLLFFLEVAVAGRGLPRLQMHFGIAGSSSVKSAIGILTGIALNL